MSNRILFLSNKIIGLDEYDNEIGVNIFITFHNKKFNSKFGDL